MLGQITQPGYQLHRCDMGVNRAMNSNCSHVLNIYCAPGAVIETILAFLYNFVKDPVGR